MGHELDEGKDAKNGGVTGKEIAVIQSTNETVATQTKDTPTQGSSTTNNTLTKIPTKSLKSPQQSNADDDLSRFQASLAKVQERPMQIYGGIVYNFKGERRTKIDFLDQYFEKAATAKTFGDLTAELQQAVIALRQTGIYRQVKVNVSEVPPALVGHLRDYCVVSVDIVERNWWTASIGGYITDNTPELQVSGALRNLWGRGEVGYGSLGTTTDTTKSLTFTAGVSKPILIGALGRHAVLHVLTHNSIYDNMAASNYTQRVIGGNLRFDMLPHSLSYDGAWRNTTLGTDPSLELQKDQGTSIKSSIRYSFTKDYRDNITLPTRGHSYQLSSEVAGLGGDVKFLRNELSFNYNFPIFKTGIAFNYLLKGGVLAPLYGDHTRVCDKFFLGGVGTALSLRGFKAKGVDNGNTREAHGGDMYYTTAAHVTFPLPFLSNYNFVRGHFFANAGNLVPIKNWNFQESAQELKERARSAVGAGIIFTTPMGGRFEFNFCHPLRMYAGDKVSKGFEFGVAMTI
eukprot:Phypoly_transcript_07559.p1 GENE.Phypoly_transcript_07559~~Phypoly_transcript_07559.p1  ORF type:complete len:538 (+),score=79.32 Phypoly_transcript_07559:75-1616(+)